MLKKIGGSIYEYVAMPFEWVSEKIGAFVDWIGKVCGISENLTGVFKNIGESIQNWLVDKFDWVINKAKDFLGWLGKIASAVGDWFVGDDSEVEVNNNSNSPDYIKPYTDNYSQKVGEVQTLIHSFTGKIVVSATGDSKVEQAEISLPKGMNMAHISG